MKVYLDNIPVAFPNNTLTEPHFVIRRKNENGQFAVSFTGELNFTGSDYDYIFNKLVTIPGAINNSIELKFVDDCCNDKVYYFLIKPESLRWCDNICEISATAVEYTPESKAYACMENTLIWDNWNGFKTAVHPKVKYCLEYRPSLLQDAILIIGMFTVFGTASLLILLGTILLPLIGTINSIINAINSLVAFGNGIISAINTLLPSGSELATLDLNLNTITILGFDDPVAIFNFVLDLFNSTNGQLIAGCGFEHPSPLVRSYVTNVCGKCNLAFDSSILNESDGSKPNSDYYNLLYFSAPVKSGRIATPYFGKPLVPYIEDNEPILNGKTFLDELIQPFNAGWDIVGNVVRFHRRDFFQTQIPFFSVNNVNYKDKIVRQCYEWSSKNRPSYAEIGYQRDAVDWCGSEAWKRWGSHVIEWNLPVNPIQKGAFTRVFPHSPARFREDKLERDVLSDYEWMPYGIGQAIKDNEFAMIMNSGTSFIPKLLIWDGYDINNATIRRSYTGTGISANAAVNYPMWVDEGHVGNLYDRFWSIENPRTTAFSGYDFEVEVVWDCDLLNAININGTIETSKGLSKTLEVADLDWTRSTVIFKGTV